MGSTFLICTRNRPRELRGCLDTLLAQTRLPEELVLVDASDAPVEAAVREQLAGHDVRLVYLHTAPGRTRQLNAGIAAATGDPVFMIDDDVELDARFHEEMLATFEAGGPEVGGVQGTITGDILRPWPMRLFRAVFLMSRHTRDAEGRLLPSGYYTTPVRPRGTRETEVMRLCGLAFRRRVLDEFAFDESLEGYALKEDVDLSWRVSRRYKLLIAPGARFRHLKTPQSRIGVRDKSKMHVVNNYRLFRKNLSGSALRWAAFAWSMLGRLLYELLRTIVKRNPGYVLGALDGFREIVVRR